MAHIARRRLLQLSGASVMAAGTGGIHRASRGGTRARLTPRGIDGALAALGGFRPGLRSIAAQPDRSRMREGARP